MAENNALAVSYDTAQGLVSLDGNTVRKYLTRGNGAISEQETMLFIKLCEAQKLNPFVNEAYLVKYGNQPAQTIVSYNAYRRRADGNPNHLYCESGIVVQRKDTIEHKQGACIYPGEKLLGGWCRVYRVRKLGSEYRQIVGAYKEASFAEYNSGKALWNDKPGTMIEKVAISQALREAYPADYEGLYTQEEMDKGVNANAEPVSTNTARVEEAIEVEAKVIQSTAASEITREMYDELMQASHMVLGKNGGDDYINAYLSEIGVARASQMTREQYITICDRLAQEVKNRPKVKQTDPEQNVAQEANTEPKKTEDEQTTILDSEEALPWDANATDAEKFAML